MQIFEQALARGERIIEYLLGPSIASVNLAMDYVQTNQYGRREAVFALFNQRAQIGLAIARGRISKQDLVYLAALEFAKHGERGEICSNLMRILGYNSRQSVYNWASRVRQIIEKTYKYTPELKKNLKEVKESA